MCGGVAHSFCTTLKWLLNARSFAKTLDVEYSVIPWSAFAIGSTITCDISKMCHSSTRLGTSLHVTQFYQAFPCVRAASDKRWGEKAWV